jgi:hypothetical protein
MVTADDYRRRADRWREDAADYKRQGKYREATTAEFWANVNDDAGELARLGVTSIDVQEVACRRDDRPPPLARQNGDERGRSPDGAGDFHPAPGEPGARPRRLTFKTLSEWRLQYTKPAWRIRGFLIRDAFDVIGGAEKSLKSWLMHHVAISVASGRDLFGDDTMSVPERGKVLLLTGEGGTDLVLDRLEHLCDAYSITLDDIGHDIVVSSDIAPMSLRHFESDIRDAVTEHDPALIQLDPMYVYLGEDREAGNVYSVGPALMKLREMTVGTSLQVAHHFTKAAASKLTLASLTQAGMREAVDHWLLISVEEHDLPAQRFVLDMERGARRGFAWSRRAEITLGPFDHDTLRHVGRPTFEWKARDAAESAWQKTRACAQNATEALEREDPTGTQGFSQTWLLGNMNITAGSDRKKAGIEQAIFRGSIRAEEGPRRTILHYYVQDYET